MEIKDLVGKTFTNIEQIGDDELIFTLSTGEKYRMYHPQDCCESVTIDDINGDLSDLLNTQIILAEESMSNNHDKNNQIEIEIKDEYDDSVTWTFYRFATIKGYVNIKWYGTSNGYYSESVYFERIN